MGLGIFERGERVLAELEVDTVDDGTGRIIDRIVGVRVGVGIIVVLQDDGRLVSGESDGVVFRAFADDRPGGLVSGIESGDDAFGGDHGVGRSDIAFDVDDDRGIGQIERADGDVGVSEDAEAGADEAREADSGFALDRDDVEVADSAEGVVAFDNERGETGVGLGAVNGSDLRAFLDGQGRNIGLGLLVAGERDVVERDAGTDFGVVALEVLGFELAAFDDDRAAPFAGETEGAASAVRRIEAAERVVGV